MAFKQGISRRKEDFDRLGLKEEIALWEDGLRTTGDQGFYEWWYNDFSLNDGITVVVIFFAKNGFDVKGEAAPNATISITYPDGKKIGTEVYGEKGVPIDAKKDVCDVKVNGTRLWYENGLFYLNYVSDTIQFNVTITPTLPMWRPGTGHFYFDEKRNDYFAWLVPVPSGDAKGQIVVHGEALDVKGTAYHDHNWGNRPMHQLMNHWYWGRGYVGPYRIIACDIVASKKYGYKRMPVIMIAKNGEILESDESKVRIKRNDTFQHPMTKKFMDNLIEFDYDGRYLIKYQRKEDILTYDLLDMVSKPKKFIAKTLGMNPTFVRVIGDISIEVKMKETKEYYENHGLWEQMFFGNNKELIIR